jgi:hypothetical protein
MTSFTRSADALLKEQTQLYVGLILGVRKCLEETLTATSKPIQTAGGLSKISSEAKSKYQKLSDSVMRIKMPNQLIVIPPKTPE